MIEPFKPGDAFPAAVGSVPIAEFQAAQGSWESSFWSGDAAIPSNHHGDSVETFSHSGSRGTAGTAVSARPAGVPLILVIEDDKDIVEILAAYLTKAGMKVASAGDGEDGLAKARQLRPDLVLLDVQLPLRDGWQVLAELRLRRMPPVIMLTAMDKDMDKLLGLRVGADDYVVKPFNPDEVVARVQAVLRRSTAGTDAGPAPVVRVDEFEIDTESHEVSIRAGRKRHVLSLTLTEFRLLHALAQSPRKVFTRQELLLGCLPEGDTQTRTVDSHVSKLRKKLEAVGVSDVPGGVRGVGYRFRGEG